MHDERLRNFVELGEEAATRRGHGRPTGREQNTKRV